MFKVRGRIEFRQDGKPKGIWGDVACAENKVGVIGTFTSQAGKVPNGTEIGIQVPTGGRQCFRDIGTWKFYDHKENKSGYIQHTIRRLS